MRRAECPGQMSLGLFGEAPRDPFDGWLRWLTDTWGCRETDVLAPLRRLFREFPAHEAGSRCKVLQHFFWRHAKPAFAEVDPAETGVYDPVTDYHVAWDRCWAVERGMDPHESMRIAAWDYARDRPADRAA